jgi:hypothetical protein
MLSRRVFCWTAILVIFSAARGVASATATPPWRDAIAIWHMDDAKNASGKGGPLTVQGDVQLGVALTGADREASLRRGGDGRVAQFNGGWLVAGRSGDQRLAVHGKTMTLCLRVRAADGKWNSPLVAKDDRDSPFGPIVYGKDGRLEYLWQTSPLADRVLPGWKIGRKDFNLDNGLLRLGVPLEVIDPRAWHDVVVRFRDANLELFVDGVLVDEEWPHGELFQFHGPLMIGAGYERGTLRAGFHGQVDHVALWDRALADDEITALAGGAETVARRDLEILGPPQASIQYWKPRGYNAWAGDCMPYYHDGTFHLFYLFDRRHHGSKWYLGAHQYAHVTTTDLVHWEHQALAVPIIRQWECAMGTGDILWHDGVHYIFYTDCGGRCEFRDKPQRGSWIFAATSTDGIHFSKDLKPLVPGGDCTIFQDPASGLFHLIRGGGNRLVSADLKSWKEVPGNFITLKKGTTGECPNHFAWNGWYYFILGANAVWKSRSPLGPWESIHPNIYDGMYVPKVAEFTGNRRILAGWIGTRGWGGHLALRELIQDPDGGLGMKFPPELIPECGAPLHPAFSLLRPTGVGDGRQIRLDGTDGFAAGMLSGVPKNVRLTLRVVPGRGVKSLGLCLRGKGDYESGCELRIEPARQRAQYGVPTAHGPARDSTDRIAGGRDYAIENVERLDRPFTLDVIVKDDLVDTCIDGRRTMITRRDPEAQGDRVFFFARGGEAAFEDITLRPLLEK